MAGTNLEYFARRQDKVLYDDGPCVITSYMGGAYDQEIEEGAFYEAYNFPIAHLFLIAIRKITANENLSIKHVVTRLAPDCGVEVHYRDRCEVKMGNSMKEKWYEKNAYCTRVSEFKSELQKFTTMLGGLNMYFGNKYRIVAAYKTAEIDYYSLTHTPDVAGYVKPVPGKGENGEDWQELVNALNADYRNLLECPVVLETSNLRRAPYEIPRHLRGVEEVNEFLHNHKLRLVAGRKRLKLVEISNVLVRLGGRV